MKTNNEVKDELRKQKHQLAKHQQMIDSIAITEFDKFFAQMEANKTHHIIKTLEWVLSDS